MKDKVLEIPLNNVKWGIFSSSPMRLAGIFKEWLKKDKKTNEL